MQFLKNLFNYFFGPSKRLQEIYRGLADQDKKVVDVAFLDLVDEMGYPIDEALSIYADKMQVVFNDQKNHLWAHIPLTKHIEIQSLDLCGFETGAYELERLMMTNDNVVENAYNKIKSELDVQKRES